MQIRRLEKVSLLFAILLIFLVFPPLVHADNGGRIYGQILDRTNKKAPVPIAGQSVILQMAQGTATKDLLTLTTDAHGAFSFDNLNTDKTVGYAVYSLYQGAQYYTDLIDLSTKSVQHIDLTVYQATNTMGNTIALVQDDILVHQPNPSTGILSISEYCFFRNIGTHTYIGSLDASHGKPNALLFSLPAQARNIALTNSFNGYQVIQVDHGFATNAALPPGDTQFSFSFEIPYTSSIYDLSHVVHYPTVTLSLLVPPSIHVSSSALTSQGIVSSNQVFQGRALLPPTEIHALFQNLPLPSAPASNASALNPALLWTIIGLFLLLAILIVATFLYRYRLIHRPDTRTGKKQRTSTGRPSANKRRPGATARATPLPAAPLAPTSPREAFLQELVELDKQFEAGKIPKAVYQERRAKKKAQLRTLMNNEEKQSPEQSTASAADKKTARRIT